MSTKKIFYFGLLSFSLLILSFTFTPAIISLFKIINTFFNVEILPNLQTEINCNEKECFLHMFKKAFDEILFYFSIQIFVFSFILIFRRQKIFIFKSFFPNLKESCLNLIFIFGMLFNIISFYVLFFELFDKTIFEQHILFQIIQILNFSGLCVYLLNMFFIWNDTAFSYCNKNLLLIMLSFFFHLFNSISVNFIYLYSYNAENSLMFSTLAEQQEVLNYVLYSYGIGVFCMQENTVPDIAESKTASNPCENFHKAMTEKCGKADTAGTLPVLRGGHKGIRILTNTTTAIFKAVSKKDCDEARKHYFDCIDLMRGMPKPPKPYHERPRSASDPTKKTS